MGTGPARFLVVRECYQQSFEVGKANTSAPHGVSAHATKRLGCHHRPWQNLTQNDRTSSSPFIPVADAWVAVAEHDFRSL